MKDPVLQTVKEFLSSFHRGVGPLLVAYSGGGDSTALLSLLLECRRFFSLDLRIVHFDHAWREESAAEADLIRRHSESLSLPFYSERAEQGGVCKEEEARKLRYAFFKKTADAVGAEAVILGHQREDAAETVLKRVLEGAPLSSLAGPEPVNVYEGIPLWRPLLTVSRGALVRRNEKKGLSYLNDPTNDDVKFLRPLMRKELFPELEKRFGKSVQKNIAFLGREFASLKGYLDEKIAPWESKKIEGPAGFAFLAEDLLPLHPLEREHLLKTSLKKRGVGAGRGVLKKAESLRVAGSFDKRFNVSSGEVVVDRGNFFWLDTCALSRGWEIKAGGPRVASRSVLEAFFSGEIPISESEGVSISFDPLSSREKKTLDTFFSQNKIPGTMRKFFPFVKKNDRIILNYSCFYEDCFQFILTINLKNISN